MNCFRSSDCKLVFPNTMHQDTNEVLFWIFWITRLTTDGGWKIDYPYAAVLDTRDSEQDADEGWFLVKGEARLDASRKDEQNLPLTLISANTLQACSEKGCADLRDFSRKIILIELGKNLANHSRQLPSRWHSLHCLSRLDSTKQYHRRCTSCWRVLR